MHSKITREHKLMAYTLHNDFAYTMTSIATLMKVSTSTVSQAIKEVGYWKTIDDLSNELSETKFKLLQLLKYAQHPMIDKSTDI